MTEHEAFMGVYRDHLYANCPSVPKPPRRCMNLVDPLRGDICGLCLTRWKKQVRRDD